ncbi:MULTISPECIES: hypothetical protein [Rhodopseudomonas]|uniref:Uncharacterized protein n=1 Tax=Rhodopseudomonas palustris (strain DX-1) TaxID=652103 RepID=E6VJE5_RHOPX|nr:MULTISPECIES: hypothetical protein [Rhodopseudomonas]NEW86292.1 hypothetical protein [Rhodopseudomonas sp. WA056]QDL97408.1 hypothetical protein FLL57_08860 [Rhodopseudomonas palustris]
MTNGTTSGLPRNVYWFEVLLLTSLMLDCISVAFQDRSLLESSLSAGMVAAANTIAAGLILLLAYLVWLAAHGRKNWARAVLTASLVFSVVSLAQIVGDSGLEAGLWIDIVSCGLTAAGVYLSFTGDARGWFNG